MATTKYTYSIANDTLNGAVFTDSLELAIGSSGITIALDHTDTVGDVLDIWMKAPISEGEETILDGLVAAHTGIAVTKTEISLCTTVENEKFEALGLDLTYRISTFLFNIPATAGMHLFDISFPYPIMLLGGTVDMHSAMVGDSMMFAALGCTTVGALTATAGIGDTWLTPNPEAMQYLFKGLDVMLGPTEVGRIMEVTSDRIRIGTPLAAEFAPGTYLTVHYVTVEKYYISAAPLVLWISRDTERGAMIEANQPMKFVYYNDTATAKKVQICLENYS